jgi:hypothetical protein
MFFTCAHIKRFLINKGTKAMQLGAIVFIIPWNALYMFRVLFTPIIWSVLKLYYSAARSRLLIIL